MPFSKPSLSDLRARIRGDIEASMPAPKLLQNSYLGQIADANAGAVYSLYQYQEWAFKQAFPDKAESEYLDQWCSIWGVSRLPASYAAGTATATGTNGTLIPAGSLLQRADGTQYATTANATIASGTASISVLALLPALAGNDVAGISLTFATPISGVDSTAIVGVGALSGGADIESDTSLRTRLLARIQSPPQGGASNDYIAWAKSVAGVTRAFVYPNASGPGTVNVAILADNDPSGPIPSGGLVTSVQSYIDARRPVTAAVTVFAPTASPVNFTIALSPSTTTVRNAVISSLQDLFFREASPGGTLYLSRIREAISIAAGEIDHTLTSPSANVVASAGSLSTIGTFTWT